MNGNFTAVKQVMWLFWMELEKEVEYANDNELCTDKTLQNILCEMSSTH